MPLSSTSTYPAARLALPDDCVRGRASALACPVYLDGALVAPDSGTATVLDPSGATISSGAVTVASSVATYSWTPSASTVLGDLWVIQWDLVFSGSTRTYRNPAAVVLHDLSPVLTDQDLYRANRGLDPASTGRLSDRADWQDQLDEAWVRIYGRIISQGRRPCLIAEPWALREPHLCLTLALIYSDFATRLPETQWAEAAKEQMELYEKAWSRLTFRYETVDAAQAHERKSARPPIFLCSDF